VNWRNNDGDSTLIAAVRRGHVDAALLLLINGANVDDVGLDSYSPLHICCRKGDFNMLNILLQSNPSTSLKTKDGKTALDIAKDKGYEDIYNRLLQHTQFMSTSSYVTSQLEQQRKQRNENRISSSFVSNSFPDIPSRPHNILPSLQQLPSPLRTLPAQDTAPSSTATQTSTNRGAIGRVSL